MQAIYIYIVATKNNWQGWGKLLKLKFQNSKNGSFLETNYSLLVFEDISTINYHKILFFWVLLPVQYFHRNAFNKYVTEHIFALNS